MVNNMPHNGKMHGPAHIIVWTKSRQRVEPCQSRNITCTGIEFWNINQANSILCADCLRYIAIAYNVPKYLEYVW